MRLSETLVVETAVGIAGPLVGRALADLGANVVKVESSLKPDISRNRVPPPGMTREDTAELFPQVHEMNAGKTSVQLNLKNEQGRALFLELLAHADVYVENFAGGWLERLGLSHRAFELHNQGLVILSQTAYGGEGPLSDQRAYAPIMTALSGMESLIGYKEDHVVPQISSSNGDLVAAYYGMLLVLAGLYEREETGRGSIIDMSQIEAATCMAGVAMAQYALSDTMPVPQASADPRYAPHGHYPTSGEDRWCAIAVWSDDQWAALCEMLGVDAADRDRFLTSESRLQARHAVDELVSRCTISHDREHLVARLQGVGVACTAVLDVAEVDDAAEFSAQPLFAPLEHPRAGTMRVTRMPWRFDNQSSAPRRVAERMGQSTISLFRDLLGYDEQQLEAWQAGGVFD
jgi:crotonobetainyl-CoA:carnitine CoA-transferase CaiB-like acyl-CoA transferase